MANVVHDGDNEKVKYIEDPGEMDVLLGRGGAALRHPGNQNFRHLVLSNKALYITSFKAEKLKISRSIVKAIREQKGRFLERGTESDVWFEVSDKRAIEKTSQALREGQPKLRQKIEEMNNVVNVATAQIDHQFPNSNMAGNTDVSQSIQHGLLKACGLSLQPQPQVMYPKKERVVPEGAGLDLFQRKEKFSIDGRSDHECQKNAIANYSHFALDSLGLKDRNSSSDISSAASFPKERRKKIDRLSFYTSLKSDIKVMTESEDEANKYCKKLEFLIWAHGFLTASEDLIKKEKEKTNESVIFSNAART
mmetsp:Transcript_7188/g.10906  ORF Transcript_7188/g.10906 Transcript_7188/m.10906 type:complete len:308 (+) Transcript_7188:293-1216(+)|eukprot:CAMPEP_0178933086 /NCGR_PEP_ID=MMETSP0786-20121207/23049_1 /TAXON_ID=186022 /ORGANISM="Thalassionema frauenfeldii, Strain CCMP 1798" /LENGTH=307 /DNA_ID=CAMNT_0020610593 /DNA_START=356 /DNA_END=1279 /DNA_ORIENTATION=-